jgi:hypothetical protein
VWNRFRSTRVQQTACDGRFAQRAPAGRRPPSTNIFIVFVVNSRLCKFSLFRYHALASGGKGSPRTGEVSDGETDGECDGRMQTPSEVAAAAFSQLCQRPGRCRPCCDVVRNGVSWDGTGEMARWLGGVTVSRPTEVNKEQVERFNIVNNAMHARTRTYRDTQGYRHRYHGVAHPSFV